MNNYCVYKHTAPNGKVYIGMTGTNPISRWQRGLGYMGQQKFFNAILKYGWDNFKHEILEDGLTKAEAVQKEAELIAAYNSVENGFNVSPGTQAPAAVEPQRNVEAPAAPIKRPAAAKIGRRTATCAYCGKEFPVVSGNKGVYCSLECRYAAMRNKR